MAHPIGARWVLVAYIKVERTAPSSSVSLVSWQTALTLPSREAEGLIPGVSRDITHLNSIF